MIPRGIRNCNPGNIRLRAGVNWEGMAPEQTDGAFVQFIDPVYGLRAIVRIMRSYEKAGIHTVGEAIDRWAPPVENNTDAYVAAVCTECGVGPSQTVSLESILPQLVKAIVQHENGEQPYTDDQVSQAIILAGT